jgi:ankyrin repeat protein
VLKYLHRIGIKLTCAVAACNGNIRVLKYLHKIGIKLDSVVALAAQKGDVAALEFLHEIGVKLESAAPYVARNGHADALKFLIEKGVKLDQSIATSAAQNDHADVLKLLHEQCISLNTCDRGGDTLAHHAVRHMSVLRYLVEIGVRMNLANNLGKTPIDLAVDYRLIEVHQLGIRNSDGSTMVHEAARRGDTTLLKLLRSRGASMVAPDHRGMTPAHYVCFASTKIGAVFAEFVASINLADCGGTTPAHLLAFRGNVEILEDLGGKLTDVDHDGQTLAHYAARGRAPIETLCALKKMGASLLTADRHGHLPIHIGYQATGFRSVTGFAVDWRDLPLADLSPGAPDRAGQTPAHYAAKYGRTGALTDIQKAGASIEEFDEEGLTPLHVAILGGHASIVEEFHTLIPGGLPAAKPTRDGRDILDLAHTTEDVEALEVVFEYCPWVDKNGSTPAHRAMVRVDQLKLAHSMGKPLGLPDANGRTPLDCAIAKNTPAFSFLISAEERTFSEEDE